MKTIVLATDLSSHSNQVARFAVALAKDWQASLVLLNAYQYWPDNPAKTGNFPLSPEAMQASSEKALKLLADDLRRETNTDVPIECIVREASVKTAIKEVTTDKHASLLIMSTVGTAPQSAQLLGSLATDMITETSVPLLLIPPHIRYAQVSNIVLGIDLASPPSAIALDTTLWFTKQFGGVINVLCINDAPNDPIIRERAKHIRQLLQPHPHTLSIVSGRNVYDSLLRFAHANKADLIVMLPKEHNWLQRLIGEGETQRVGRLTAIPLLAIV